MDNRGRQVEEFVGEWAAAEHRSDAAFLERALTDDFVGVGPLRHVSTGTPRWRRVARSRLASSKATTWEGNSARRWCSWRGTVGGCWPAGTRAPSRATVVPEPLTTRLSESTRIRPQPSITDYKEETHVRQTRRHPDRRHQEKRTDLVS